MNILNKQRLATQYAVASICIAWVSLFITINWIYNNNCKLTLNNNINNIKNIIDNGNDNNNRNQGACHQISSTAIVQCWLSSYAQVIRESV